NPAGGAFFPGRVPQTAAERGDRHTTFPGRGTQRDRRDGGDVYFLTTTDTRATCWSPAFAEGILTFTVPGCMPLIVSVRCAPTPVSTALARRLPAPMVIR